jgi:hypothetical protein
MAANPDDPQPHQAPQAPPSHDHSLNRTRRGILAGDSQQPATSPASLALYATASRGREHPRDPSQVSGRSRTRG